MTFETTKALLLVAGALGAAAPLVAAAQPTTTTTLSVAPGKAVATQLTKASAVVVALDPTYRIVTLKAAGGKVFELVAGPEVRNFDQLKVGDKVHAEYVEALSLELKKKGAGVREGSEKEHAVRAPAGEKPGGAVGRQVAVLADVVAIDRKTHLVTLRGPKGNLVDLHVEDPEQLKNIKKGDQVEAVYTEAIAVMVR